MVATEFFVAFCLARDTWELIKPVTVEGRTKFLYERKSSLVVSFHVCFHFVHQRAKVSLLKRFKRGSALLVENAEAVD